MNLNIKQRVIHRREKNVVVFRYLNYTNDNLFASFPSSEYVDRAKREGKNNTGYRFTSKVLVFSNSYKERSFPRKKVESFLHMLMFVLMHAHLAAAVSA